jgi:hypothetical protein
MSQNGQTPELAFDDEEEGSMGRIGFMGRIEFLKKQAIANAAASLMIRWLEDNKGKGIVYIEPNWVITDNLEGYKHLAYTRYATLREALAAILLPKPEGQAHAAVPVAGIKTYNGEEFEEVFTEELLRWIKEGRKGKNPKTNWEMMWPESISNAWTSHPHPSTPTFANSVRYRWKLNTLFTQE